MGQFVKYLIDLDSLFSNVVVWFEIKPNHDADKDENFNIQDCVYNIAHEIKSVPFLTLSANKPPTTTL